jgi:hypothetical protein
MENIGTASACITPYFLIYIWCFIHVQKCKWFFQKAGLHDYEYISVLRGFLIPDSDYHTSLVSPSSSYDGWQFFLSSALLCFAFSGKERRKTISRIMDDGVAFKQTEYESCTKM